ncbi:hydroxyisourate hydrolase [Reinekea thalattae]|uniref:5-hydroxyisourate hydrolase n=1 Tax=Reinekea thalattae TaxID=2593301 RepID=A0A5C8Z409_9GAMM|nr:hydroxyisourate hydrolase [Reinekea thalattae]TXR51911.1 hydroxyisourate hydrolase [Reinekea thalattae]
MSRSPITTHVLDTATGKPAENVSIELHKLQGEQYQQLAVANTDADGRIAQWPIADDQLGFGQYKLVFNLKDYYGDESFFPTVDIAFVVSDERHHHVPLLLSPFGYSTYRGS